MIHSKNYENIFTSVKVTYRISQIHCVAHGAQYHNVTRDAEITHVMRTYEIRQ